MAAKTGTYTLIASSTLGSNQNIVEFTNISGSYTDLFLVCTWIENSTEDLCIRVGNGSLDTGSNYSNTYLYGNGTTATSGRQSSTTFIDVSQIPATTSIYTTTIINFMDYANTTTNKTILSRSGNANYGTVAQVALWRSTSAINYIRLNCGYGSNTFNSGSTFKLYGIEAGNL